MGVKVAEGVWGKGRQEHRRLQMEVTEGHPDKAKTHAWLWKGKCGRG